MKITKVIILLTAMFLPAAVYAIGGNVNYEQGAQALATTYKFATIMIIYMTYLINAFGAIVGIYGALQIYIKMQTGGGDITRSILYLIGGAIFLIAGMVVLPGVFGYQYTNGGGSWNWNIFGF